MHNMRKLMNQSGKNGRPKLPHVASNPDNLKVVELSPHHFSSKERYNWFDLF